ncbi:MAG TPA: VWA domain-containing protein [Gemmataceae bacterium]|nr:VWA domain-containing protein [Gemmataceae bacterium]
MTISLLHHWFAHPAVLWLLALLPALGVLLLWSRWRKRRALARLGAPASLQTLVQPAGGRRFWRGVCIGLGLTTLVLGTAGPQWGRDWDQSAAPGRDLVVVLDCSRSMFAETPSRLERAKTALLDLCETMRQRGGHRVALVVFAGAARLACPLTHDYDHFREAVEAVDAETPDPEIEPGPDAVSGTRIGAALHTALLAQDERFGGARDILLLSDGDDPARDGEWKQGAAEARAQGVPICAVGLGDPDTPSTIRIGGEVIAHQGEQVHTQLQEAPLRDLADATHGTYIAAQTRALSLGRIYLDAIAGQAERQESDDALPVYRPQYVWFLAAGFVFLALAVAISDRGRRDRQTAKEKSQPTRLVTLSPCLLVCLAAVALSLSAAAPSADWLTLVRQGDAAYERGDYAAAATLYEQAQDRAVDPGLPTMGLAAAKMRLAEASDADRTRLAQEAARAYRCCTAPDDPRRARALYGLGDALMLKADGRDADALQDAVAAYRQCLAEPNLDGELTRDARHNLERARLQLLQIPPSAAHRKDEPSGDGPPKTPPPPDKGSSPQADPSRDPSSAKVKPDPNGKPAKSQDAGKPLETDAPPPPGEDKLPPVPDRADLPPLSAEDAARHLDQAAQRILQDLKAHRRSKAAPPPPNVRDW